MPKYIGSLNYDIIDSNEDPLSLMMMGYTPYQEGYTNVVDAEGTSGTFATPQAYDINYHPTYPDPVRAYNPTPVTTSTQVPIKNEYTGQDVNYDIPMGFNPNQYAVNNPGVTADKAYADYISNPDNKGFGGAQPSNQFIADQFGNAPNLPQEGGFGYIPYFGGDITPDIVEALKSYPQYYGAFDPSKWDVGNYNFTTGGTSVDPSQGWNDVSAMRNKDTGEWLSFANAYKMHPHEAQQIYDLYQQTKGSKNWFEKDFLQPVIKGIESAIPTIAASALGNYILPGIGGAIGGAIGGVAGQSIAGNPVSMSNWQDQVVPAVAGGVAGYYGGGWGDKLASGGADLTGTYLGSTAAPLAEDLTGTYLGSTAAPIAEDLTGTFLGSTAEYIPEAVAPSVNLGKEAAMFLSAAPRENPVYDLEKDFLGQAGLADITNSANRSSNAIGTDFMNTAMEMEQGKAFDMYSADMERAQMEQLAAMEQQRQQMLSAREQEYMAQQRAYEEYLNSVIPRMQQAYTYTSPFNYSVPDTSNLMSGERILTEEDTPNVYYGPETTYRQQQSELARRGIRRGSKNTRAFV